MPALMLHCTTRDSIAQFDDNVSKSLRKRKTARCAQAAGRFSAGEARQEKTLTWR
jgi:hypothetical protein